MYILLLKDMAVQTVQLGRCGWQALFVPIYSKKLAKNAISGVQKKQALKMKK